MNMRLNWLGGVCVAFVVALAIGLSVPSVFAQTAQEANPESFQRSFPMSSGGTLVVENRKGTIHITGSDTKQVVVNVRKIFEGGSEYVHWLD